MLTEQCFCSTQQIFEFPTYFLLTRWVIAIMMLADKMSCCSTILPYFFRSDESVAFLLTFPRLHKIHVRDTTKSLDSFSFILCITRCKAFFKDTHKKRGDTHTDPCIVFLDTQDQQQAAGIKTSSKAAELQSEERWESVTQKRTHKAWTQSSRAAPTKKILINSHFQFLSTG